MELLLRQKVSITGSGRTDTGVHALQQYFHFDFNEILDHHKFIYKLNSFLTPDISIKAIKCVNADAHARFSATERSYIYKINQTKDPFEHHLSYSFSKKLNIKQMQKACESLVGERDFKSFSRVKTDVNNFICNVFHAEWCEQDEKLTFNISANRFLRGMVRCIVGTMLSVGEGKVSLDQFNSIINAKDRTRAGRAVPPEGLYLSKVIYPKEILER